MGIRVFCPNGHRLNLKSHLAGKQGICPHCGMTVAIPSLEKAEELGMLKNPRLAEREKALGASYGETNGSGGSAVAVASAPAEPATAKTSAPDPSCGPSLASPYARTNGASSKNGADRGVASLDDGGIEIGSAAAENPSRRSSSSTAAVAPQAAPAQDEIDPIAENPQAVWYVRTPQGGQYGPAAGDIMRKWIGEGRVQADFWVWREGWADWQKASASLPGLKHAAAPVASPAAAPSAPSAPKTVEPNPYAGPEAPVAARPARSRRRGIHPLAVLAVAGLGLVCLALTGVLIAMLAGAL